MTSNSDSSTLNKDKKQEEAEVSSKANSDFPNGFRISGSSEPERDGEEAEEAESMASCGSSNLKNRLSLGAIEVAENEDGFKTPSSSEYMIPPVSECPPAPKKQRPRRTRASPPQPARRGLRIDWSDEVDSMFSRSSQEDQGPEIKRSRRANTV